MNKLLIVLLLLLSLSTFAHDEGHGPALKDESLYGGKISAIIDAKEVNLGRDAKMLFKGEIVHSSSSQDVKLYIYDTNMKNIDLKKMENKVNAVQIEKNKEYSFVLTLDKTGKYYVGKRPKQKRVPFNIDIKVKNESQTLFGAFDGLD